MIELTDRQTRGSVEDMGKHGKPEKGYNAVTNPTGTSGDGAGPIKDSYTNQALVDAWNIDAAYDRAAKKAGKE